MELRDYWHRLGRRRLALVAAPVVAGVVALGIGMHHPPSYTSVTTVQVPIGDHKGPIEARQDVANFQALAMSDAVVSDVSRHSGVAAGKLAQQITISQDGSGNVVEISFKAADKARASLVTSTAAKDAVEGYLRPQTIAAAGVVDKARQQWNSMQQQADSSTRALDDFVAKAGVPTPQQHYAQAQASVNQLQNEYNSAVAHKFTLTAGNLKSALDAAKRDLVPLARAAQSYTQTLSSLTAARQQAQSAVIAAKSDLLRAQSTAAGVPPASGLTTTITGKNPRASAIEQLVAAAVLLAVLVAALWLALAQYLEDRRSPRAAAHRVAASSSVPETVSRAM